MSEKLKEYVRQSIDELLKSLPAEELHKAVTIEEGLKGLPAEERLKGLSVEEVIRGLSADTLEALIRKLKDNNSAPKPE